MLSQMDQILVFSSSSRVDKSVEEEYKDVPALEVIFHACFAILLNFINIPERRRSWFWAIARLSAKYVWEV